MLKQFKEDVERFEVQRQELSNAEQLFDLPITVYPELIQVQKELKGQEQIYTIYEEQKVLLCCCELIFLMYLANQLCESRKHSDWTELRQSSQQKLPEIIWNFIDLDNDKNIRQSQA